GIVIEPRTIDPSGPNQAILPDKRGRCRTRESDSRIEHVPHRDEVLIERRTLPNNGIGRALRENGFRSYGSRRSGCRIETRVERERYDCNQQDSPGCARSYQYSAQARRISLERRCNAKTIVIATRITVEHKRTAPFRHD